jgi:hypothetical protein
VTNAVPSLTNLLIAGCLVGWALAGRWLRWPRGRTGDALCVLLLLAVTAWAYWPWLCGKPPMSWDHNEHLLKVVETEDLLARGRLFGWTNRELAGFPHNVQYPAVAYLVTAALHALPFVSLTTAYAWTLFLFLACGQALAVYFAGRLLESRAVGVLAAVMALCDPGSPLYGGWEWNIHTGVWLAAVSTAGTLLGIALALAALRDHSRPRLVAAGLLLGFCVVFHPIAMALIALSLPPLLIAIVSTDPAPSPRRLVEAALVVAVAGLAVCAWWVIPAMATRAFTMKWDYSPASAQEVWEDLIQGRPFKLPALVGSAALCGLIAYGRRESAFRRYAVLLVLGFLAFDQIDALRLLGLYTDDVQRVAINALELRRWTILPRYVCYIAGATALVGLVRASRIGSERALLGRLAALVLACLLLYLPPAATVAWPDPVPTDLSASERGQLDDLLQKARAYVGRGERMALFAGASHQLIGPAVLNGFSIEKIGFPPATQFNHYANFDDPAALARLGTTAVLCRDACPPPIASLPRIASVGPFVLYRMEKQPPAWIEEGPGEARVVSWDDQRIVVDVREAGPQSQLRLMLGYYPAWREGSGAVTAPFDKLGPGLTTMPARNGLMTLSYHKPAVEWLGLALTLAAALGCWLLLRRDARARR